MPSTAGSTTPTGGVPRPDRPGRVPGSAPSAGRTAGPTHSPGGVRGTRPTRPLRRIRRFSRAERTVHRATGLLMMACLVSAACLYIGPLALLVGRRHLMVTVHEWSGISLPLPFLLGLFSAEFRADLRRLNRFAPYDREWLRAVRTRRRGPEARPAGKFNAGQKIFAGWLAGAVLVMAFTGLLMWRTGFLPAISRTSAIFVHDLLAWALAAALLGHVRKAFEDPETLQGMRTGYVSPAWVARHHPRWPGEERDENERNTP